MGTRSWTITINNYTDEHLELLERFKLLCNVLYTSFEVGESLTPHIQGYFTLKRAKRLTALKKIFGDQPHFEKANGNKDDNYCYIFKEGSTPHIKHDNGGQGKRNDITDFMDNWKEAGLKHAINTDISTYVKYHKGLEKAHAILNAPERRTAYPNVVWLYGPTGIGKTEMVLEDNDYVIIANYPWFNGYTNQKWVVFDEFDKWDKKMSNKTLLQLLDKYDIEVEVKGHTVRFNPPNILITTSVAPHLMFPEDVWQQVDRRVSKIGTRQNYEDEWIWIKE